ncbi:MAG: HNH endonuclease [Phycisphaerales bacterium]|nr:HNH endonuclease [Phycisphaerales bacterium]
MSTQRVIIEIGHGRRRRARTVEIPSDDALVAASIELRRLGEGKHPAVGRYGTCIGAYFPSSAYSLPSVDPFTGARGATMPGGTIPERCTFWCETIRVVADTMFERDPPQMHHYCKKAPDPEPGLFEPTVNPLEEGTPQQVTQTAYERNPALRDLCIRIHGSRCKICGTSFGDTYGPAAAGFIHVHHLEPLGAVGQAHVVNPATDLIPVCPNCHGVIHLRTPPLTPDEVKAMLDCKR